MDRYLRFIEHCRKKNYHPDEYLEKHHITPKHEGGNDAKENLIKLSLIDHVRAHRIRYETYGNKYDLAASSYMSGQSAEAKRAICSANGSKSKGRKLTKEHKNKVGRPGELNPFYGKTHTEEARQIIREKATGRKWSEESKDKLGETLKARPDITRPRRCHINGKNYPGLTRAAYLLNISKSLLKYRLNSLNYENYHWIDPPSEHKRSKASKKVLIDNIEYPSISNAGMVLGIHPTLVSKRCKSDKYPNYTFVTNGGTLD
jgi:hypothetical protein